MSVQFLNKRAHHLKYYDPYDEGNIISILPQLAELKSNDRNGFAKGVVRCIKNGVTIENCLENVVVGLGRKFVAQRLFNVKHASDDDVTDYIISHFGIGDGGVTVSGSTVSLLSPERCDLDLYNAIPLSNNDPLYLDSPGDIYKSIDPANYVVKPILPTGSIDIIQTSDIACDYAVNSYVRCLCVISINEPNYLVNDDDYININESALYCSNGTEAFTFAHICFSSKTIEKKCEFIVEWYMLC